MGKRLPKKVVSFYFWGCRKGQPSNGNTKNGIGESCSKRKRGYLGSAEKVKHLKGKQ